MPRFIYTLKDEKGRDYQGTVEAKNRREVETKLDTKGYYLTSLKKEGPLKLHLFSQKVSRMDVIVFAHQLATMLEAGIPIIRSLMALAAQTNNSAFQIVINNIRADIEGGAKTSDSMAKYPQVFSDFFIGLVRTGEAAGTLSDMLRRISIYLEKEEDLRRKVRSACAYPAVVTFVAITVVIFLVIFVVPTFQQVYNSIGVKLPLPTIILIAISNFMRKKWMLLLITIIGTILGIMGFNRTEKGKLYIDKLKLSLPLFGELNKKAGISRFIRGFASLISSGIPITKALSVSETITTNRVIANVIKDKVKIAVIRGDSVADSLKIGRIFPPVVVQMTAAGEESGALDTMLLKSADFVDEEVDRAIKNLTVKIEPVLTFALAVVVGFIALAIYLPMFDLIRQISR